MLSNKDNREKRTAKQPVEVERRQIEEAAARARMASESAVDEMDLEPRVHKRYVLGWKTLRAALQAKILVRLVR